MITIPEKEFTKRKNLIEAFRTERYDWWTYWREIADYFMPKRYLWLVTPNERKKYLSKNPKILDPTGTRAGRVLAAGMMNGITSPARPWFKLRLDGFLDDLDTPGRIWLDEVERRMLIVMAETNFYNSIDTMYLDLVFFGTSSILIYEDPESVFRCYNCALGEYYLGQSYRQSVNRFAREFNMKVSQLAEWFGEENLSEALREKMRQGGARLNDDVLICHLIEPNDGSLGVAKSLPFHELYWESTGVNERWQVLRKTGYHEWPGIHPRWELTGNDSYGTSPAMDTLGDVIQLQHETMRKAQGFDYMLRPPMLADQQLQNKPNSMLPGGITYVANLANSGGAKPAYQITPPIQEMTLDIRDIQQRITLGFYNNLFADIQNLQTVRSAEEIRARVEEKLVLLGPVLQRFENEALSPAITRIFGLMQRARLFPDPPASIAGAHFTIQYVSILNAAQSAVGVAPTERLLGLIGNLAAVFPEALDIPNIDNLLSDYGRALGVKAAGLNTKEQITALRQNRAQRQGMAENVQVGTEAAKGAQLLSQTDVGGGANALQQLLGGGQ